MSLTKWRLLYAALMLATLLVMLVVAQAVGGNTTRLGMVLWALWVLISGGYNKQRMRILNDKLDALWRLADQKGLTAADLKAFAPQYGTLDIKMTRPGRRQFYPAMKAIDAMLAGATQA
ncbi:hypothetical protein ACFQ3L_07270 [Lacticaseibacillus jixianensis]|uniref:Uncharacterized protein n=1 Tax=Lacticaseibacillus jixianensis TaxID=2486012 RepID=A0ABW4B9H1_9LACO|nr:hypothetical protein [Lacticaseibacillus jixianensis]